VTNPTLPDKPARRDFLDELNPQQREAVTHGEGPLLIIAGAGTGKTKTLAYRVAWLVKQGVPADRILLLTFTRRAAEEMLNRAKHVTGSMAAAKVWGGTFHAVGNRLLRMHGQAIKLAPDFTVMDDSDTMDMLGLIKADLDLASRDKRFPRKTTILKIYSRVVNSREALPRVLKKEYPWCIEAEEGLRRIFQEYTKRKQERQVLDYDDLLLFWNGILDVREVAEHMEGRFLHVLVDEYQDTNIIQSEILQKLRRGNKNITVVGDDAQSIYGFRAATIKNIIQFPNQFPGTRVVTLEENYRSVQTILDVGNAVMKPARYKYTKNLWSSRASEQKPFLIQVRDETEQCRVVCEKILKHWEQGVPLHQQAVLFRAGQHSDQLELELARRGIPFVKYGGLKFIEHAHVKDMLAFLRVLENPREEVSWYRILNMLHGVGPKTTRTFLNAFAALKYDLKKLPELPLPTAANSQYRLLTGALLAVHEQGEKLKLPSQIERLRQYYDPLIPLLYDNPDPRLADMSQLEEAGKRYRSRRAFIDDLTLDPPDSTADLAGPPYKNDDWLILSTMHSAKGCEWQAVHIIHAADGNIPSDMALGDEREGVDEEGLEEERRLFYVAITRAKDWLYVYFPLRYYFKRFPLGDGHSYAQRSRFLTEEILPFFETRIVDAYGLEDIPIQVHTQEDIRGKIGESWNY
jgi:DNA helicase-2/ATP-dependent DNA helicase PcrA